VNVTAQPVDTVIACLTPPGAGAIAVLAVHGPDAWTVLTKLFRRGSQEKPGLPDPPTPGRFWLGKLNDGASDEVVLALKQLQPTPWLELHTHGGREVVHWLFEMFAAQGIRACNWSDFLLRTTPDVLQASAWVALAEAPTARTASILLDQAHGAFSRALASVHDALAHNACAVAASNLAEMMRFAPLGRHLTSPWQVVIAGAPNVGKSSLINALAGFQRSVVAPTPGTTRDVVRTCLAIDGWPVEIADTAGLRIISEELEGAGVGLARRAVAAADLCIWVLDAASEPVRPDFPTTHLLWVVNKIDLPAVWDVRGIEGAIQVSAKTGAGLTELCEAITHRLVPEVPAAGTPLPFIAELCDKLHDVQQAIIAGNTVRASQLLAAMRRASLDIPRK
jgi:tRNA modification GTPase